MSTPRRTVAIPAGATWTDSALWLNTPYIYADVAPITPAWPTRLTVAGHGLTVGYVVPVYLTRAGQLDTTADTPHYAAVVDTNTLELLGVNSLSMNFDPAQTPRIAWLTPQNVSGATAKIQFRNTVTGAVLVELTETSGIALSGARITLTMTPAQTRALLAGRNSLTKGTAQFEITPAGGGTYRLWQYEWSCTPEWTRESA